jgi:hypothetical protein
MTDRHGTPCDCRHVTIVVAFGAWQAAKPMPKDINDPAWKCETALKYTLGECVGK